MVLVEPTVSGLFVEGARHRWEDGVVSRLDLVWIGDLDLPTGRVVPRDVYEWVDDTSVEDALALTLPVGSYPVTIAVVHWDQPSDPATPAPLRLVTGVKLQVTDQDVVSWELGRTSGQETAPVTETDFPGFSVDGGFGALLDVAGLPFAGGLQDDLNELAGITERAYDEGALILQAGDSGAGILIFACGMGDGLYPTWVGRDSSGKVSCLVLDLELLSRGELLAGDGQGG
jgi:hypothetical protein